MKHYKFHSCLLFTLFILFSVGIAYSDMDRVALPVQPICEDDLICHFEDDFCGTVSGSVVSCPGTSGMGACIDGGYIDWGDDDKCSAEILGFECQVIFDQLPGSGNHAAGLITKYKNHVAPDSEWGLFVEGNIFPEPRWMLTGDGTDALYSDCVVETGEIYHVQAMICQGLAGVWVNGTLVVAGTINRNENNTLTPVIIGNSASHDNYFYGTIDEVRIGCIHDSCTVGTRTVSWGKIKTLAQ